MPIGPLSGVIDHLRAAVLPPGAAAPTDRQLLADYVRRRDGAAVAALVRRHAPRVGG